MSQYYKLNDKTDADDIKMIASLVGMGVLEPAGTGPPEGITDEMLTEMAAETWIFRKKGEGSTLKVGTGTERGVAECPYLPSGYYHIIKADR